jgi:hypothetical protein
MHTIPITLALLLTSTSLSSGAALPAFDVGPGYEPRSTNENSVKNVVERNEDALDFLCVYFCTNAGWTGDCKNVCSSTGMCSKSLPYRIKLSRPLTE